MNKVELVSEGHGNIKKIHGNERILCCLVLRNIINGRSVLETSDKCKENWKGERKNIPCENIYLVTVHMSGKILED